MKSLARFLILALIFTSPIRRIYMTTNSPCGIIADDETTVTCKGIVGPNQDLKIMIDNGRFQGYTDLLVSIENKTKTHGKTDCFALTVVAKYKFRDFQNQKSMSCRYDPSADSDEIADKWTLDVKLKVAAEIKFVGIGFQTTKTVMEGDTYALQCVSHANPPPNYEFEMYDGDETYSVANGDILMRVAKAEHAGRYVCKATISEYDSSFRETYFSGIATLKVTRKRTKKGTSTSTLVVAIAVPIVGCLAIAGVAVYFCCIRGRVRPDATAGHNQGQNQITAEAAYQSRAGTSSPRSQGKRGSVAASHKQPGGGGQFVGSYGKQESSGGFVPSYGQQDGGGAILPPYEQHDCGGGFDASRGGQHYGGGGVAADYGGVAADYGGQRQGGNPVDGGYGGQRYGGAPVAMADSESQMYDDRSMRSKGCGAGSQRWQ